MVQYCKIIIILYLNKVKRYWTEILEIKQRTIFIHFVYGNCAKGHFTVTKDLNFKMRLLSRNARSNKCNPQLAIKLFFEWRISSLTRKFRKKFCPSGEIQTHNPLSTRQKVTNLASNLRTLAANAC